ncbi:MAG: hypothetical protein IPN72_25440 [Saprospiraceae bacterium]|nr:hypothetical protein [Saprospiraceae bacterium]
MLQSKMKKPFIIGLVLLMSTISHLSGQSFWFGPKIGAGLNFQKWNDFSPNPLLQPSYDFFIESFNEESPSSLFMNVGYHVRGSGIRAFTFQGDFFGNQGFKFKNAVLEVGGKRFVTQDKKINPFYMIGLRAEYNIGTNLQDYERFLNPFYPHNDFVRKLVYGASIGGGFEYNISEFYRGFIEISLAPDFANQYFQPPINNIIDPYTGQKISLQERQIKNTSLEIRAGFKFLRKVIYE